MSDGDENLNGIYRPVRFIRAVLAAALGKFNLRRAKYGDRLLSELFE